MTTYPARVLCVVILGLLAHGCASTRRQPVQMAKAPLEMDALIFEVGPDGGGFRVFSPRDLLEKAEDAPTCEEALTGYQSVLEKAPSGPASESARYQMGLCLEALDRSSEALQVYETLLREVPDSSWALDAQLRRGYCLERLGRSAEAAQLYEGLHGRLRAPDLEVGLTLRQGIALFQEQRLGRAAMLIGTGLAALKNLEPSLRADLAPTAAEAAYTLGEISRRDVNGLELHLDDLEQLFSEKSERIRKARTFYVEAVSYKDAQWAARAVVAIAQMYEDLHRELSALPDPEELSGDTLAYYRTETSHRLRPLIEKAFDAYLKVILLGERVGFVNDAVEYARGRVPVLEDVLAHSQPAEQG